MIQRFRNAFYQQRSQITVTRYFNIWWWTILGCIVSLTGLVVVIYGFSGICVTEDDGIDRSCIANLVDESTTENSMESIRWTCTTRSEHYICSAQFFLGILCCLLGIHVISVFSYCWMSRGHDIMAFAPIVNRLRDSDRNQSLEARNELVRKEVQCKKMRTNMFNVVIRRWKLPNEVENIIRGYIFQGADVPVEGGSCFKSFNKAMVYLQIIGLLVVAQIGFGFMLHYLLFNFTSKILLPVKTIMRSTWNHIYEEFLIGFFQKN